MEELAGATIYVLLIHTAIGLFLAFGWWRSGNLANPALVHALIDGVRNMVLM